MKCSFAIGLMTIAFGSTVFADHCSQACTDAKNTCMGQPDANRATCAAAYAACLGYNPYDTQPYVEPTACSVAATPIVTPTAASASASVDACAKACAAKKDTCQGNPNANRATCAAEYASCLGYNPYDTQPYVVPTACSKAVATPTASESAVVTAAGDRVKPAVALLALGAAVIL